MTWGEWIESEYNTGTYHIATSEQGGNGNTISVGPWDYLFIPDEGRQPELSDEIVAGGLYRFNTGA